MEFILFIGIIILLFWVGSLSGRISMLEKRIRGQVTVEPLAKPVPTASEHQTFLQPKSVATPPFMEMPKPPASYNIPEKKPMTEAQATEVATGWLNKIGMVALLLGMVFFFKYAVDQGWINPWMRVGIGFIVAGLLVYLGELWKEKYGSKAHALSGGGIALFYFTIFAMYQFYILVSQPVAWVLMLVVAVLSIFLSFRYSSLTLGFLGFFGAYGSPLMLSSGKDQQVSLLAYLTVLNIVAVAICVKKFWSELLFLALMGTIVDYSAWAGNYSTTENTFNSLFFIILTALVLVVGSAALVRYHKEKNTLQPNFDKALSLVYILAGCFYFVAIWLLLDGTYHNYLAPLALLGSVLFFFTYALVDRLEFKSINYCLSLVAAWLLVYSAVWQFSGKPLTFALLLISLVGMAIGFLLKREELRVWSLVVLFVSLFKSLFDPYGAADTVFLFNAKFGLMFANTLGLLFVGWLYTKFEPTEFEKNTEKVLQIMAAVVLWFSVSWDLNIFRLGFQGSSMALWWVVYPMALAWVGYAGKRSALLKLSLLLLCAGLIKVLVVPYTIGAPFLFNAKFGLMLLQSIGLFVVGSLYAKAENKPENLDVFYVLGSLLLWLGVSWDLGHYFQGSQSVNARNLLLSLWWVVYAVVLMAVSSAFRKPVFRKVAIALFALSILKVFLYDVSALDTPYRIVAFIVLGVILLSVSFAYRKNKEKIVNFLEGEKE